MRFSPLTLLFALILAFASSKSTLAWTTNVPLSLVVRPRAGAAAAAASSSSSSSSSTTALFWRPFATKEKTQGQDKAEAEPVEPVAETKQDDNDENNKQIDPKAKMASLMKPIKEAGVAGALSLFLWEAAFWIISIPVCSIAYYQTTGSWPDWQNAEDVAKVGAEAFAFANIARFALPLRISLAIATTPWVQANLVDKFGNKENEESENEA